jgi:hypothetical protein
MKRIDKIILKRVKIRVKICKRFARLYMRCWKQYPIITNSIIESNDWMIYLPKEEE